MWAIKAAAVVATCHDNQSENKYVTCHANSEIVNAAVQSACSQTRQSRTPAPMHMVVKRRNADEQEHSIFVCLLQIIRMSSHRKVKASSQTSLDIVPSSFSCACRGAPPWCQGWRKRVLWFPAERRFTIDRQGRAECNSIGDYWAT